jgi:DNA-binding GntR family transcriptional regulator
MPIVKSKAGHGAGESLTQDTYEKLRTEVLSGLVKPKAKLKIKEICARLNVSQGAAREALSRLASEGLLVAEPQKGFRACSISADELHDLTTARIEVEGWCLSRAIELGGVTWERDLIAAYYELARTPERVLQAGAVRMHDEWSALHMDFHERLVAACDSPWMLRMRFQLFVQAERYRRLSVPLQVSRRDTNTEHLEIMEAALAHDTKKAKEYLAEHFRSTTKILMDSLNLETALKAQLPLPRERTNSKRAADAAALVSRLTRNARRGPL